MKLSHFDYKLPQKLLAQHPSQERDESRLMLLNRKEQTIEHLVFKDIIDFFDEGDVIVLNNTKVFPARLYGNKEKTGARIEDKLYFGEDESLVAEVIDNTTSRGRTLRFLFDGPYNEFREKLQELGETPLPKYITRPVEVNDKDRFQTIYAKKEGAVAAPTAGLHFSKHLLKKLEIKGILLPEITLHIGLGTFAPVEVEDLSKHKMDSEELQITQNTASIINDALKNNKRICAVGTTVMRGLESSVSSFGTLNPYEGWTHKFIYPPFDFSIANSMITNFHTPKSTLIMMVSAFGGLDFVLKAYKEAIKKKYNFFSYGDAMMII